MNNDINKEFDENELYRIYNFIPLKTFLPKTSPRGQPIEARSIKALNSRVKAQFLRD